LLIVVVLTEIYVIKQLCCLHV